MAQRLVPVVRLRMWRGELEAERGRGGCGRQGESKIRPAMLGNNAITFGVGSAKHVGQVGEDFPPVDRLCLMLRTVSKALKRPRLPLAHESCLALRCRAKNKWFAARARGHGRPPRYYHRRVSRGRG